MASGRDDAFDIAVMVVHELHVLDQRAEALPSRRASWPAAVSRRFNRSNTWPHRPAQCGGAMPAPLDTGR